MELFSDVVRGPYAFLLILQILIVSGLLLTLIWLIIQRTREAALKQATATTEAKPVEKTDAEKAAAGVAGTGELGEALGEPLLGEAMDGAVSGFGSAGEAAPLAAQTAPDTPAVAPAANAGSTNESAPHSAANSSAASELLAEKDREMKLLSDESLTLKDKIKYLESRLMEYEIVQEEISNLSQLRVENERLKEELLQFQASRKPAEAGTPAVDPAAATSGTPGSPTDPSNPVLDNVSQDQIDNILKKLDQITSAKV